ILSSPPMPTRPNRKNASARPFAGLKTQRVWLNRPIRGCRFTSGWPDRLTDGQSAPTIELVFEGDIAVDALVLEFMVLVMLALCVIVVAAPISRRPSVRAQF